MSHRTRLSGVFDSETLGLAAFVTSPQLPLSLQLSLQPSTGVHHVPHLPLPVHPETFDLLSQVALGFDGLTETAFLCHLHKFQFLCKYWRLLAHFRYYHGTVFDQMLTYLLKAAFCLHGRWQLLLLLHPHPHDLLQDLFSGLFCVHASVQHLSQGVDLWTDRPRQRGGTLGRPADILRGQTWWHVGAGRRRWSQRWRWHRAWQKRDIETV